MFLRLIRRNAQAANPLKGTEYEQMHDKLTEFLESQQIDSSKCDAFEETILKVMGIQEEPKGCRFGHNASLGYTNCFLMLTISEEACAWLIHELNRKYPGIRARNITQDAMEKYGLDPEIDDKQAQVLVLNALWIKDGLLPDIKKYFAEHPELVSHYQSYNHTAKTIGTQYAAIVKQTPDAKIPDENVFSLLWPLFLEGATKATIMPDALPQFSLDLVGLVCRYLDWPLIRNAEERAAIMAEMDPNIAIDYTGLSHNIQSPLFTDLNIFFKGPATAALPHKAFARCINGFTPGAATVSDVTLAEGKTTLNACVVRVQNAALVHPGLMFKVTETLQKHAAEQKALKDQKKEKEDKVEQKIDAATAAPAALASEQKAYEPTQEDVIQYSATLLGLNKIIKYVSNKKEYKEAKENAGTAFVEALQQLVEHIRNGKLEDSERYDQLRLNTTDALTNLLKNLDQTFLKREQFAQGFFDHSLSFNDILHTTLAILMGLQNKLEEEIWNKGQEQEGVVVLALG